MSQAPLATQIVATSLSAGNNALSTFPSRREREGAPGHKVRTPLSLVPPRATRRRMPFAVFSFAVLVVALATVLMLNISVSSTQYELVQLRNQQIGLNQENQALVQKIEDQAAPQNLAAAATELGMVASATFGTIDVSTLKVAGVPEPAKDGNGPRVVVAAPEVTVAEVLPQAVLPPPVPKDTVTKTIESVTPPAVSNAQGVAREIADTGGTLPAPRQSIP